MQNEQARFDELITKKHQKIEKVMEQYHGLNIKTSVLGQDGNMNEYWFFKDDPMRLFVKRLEDNKHYWYFLDREEKFEQFFESLNPRGIREKKLIENLKKVRLSLKMKKSRKQEKEEEEEENALKEDQEMDDGNNEESKGGDKHHLFENDDYEQSIIDSVWFNKSMPKRRPARFGRGGNESLPNQITLAQVKTDFLEIEALYSSTMKDLSREWDTPEIRETIIAEIRETDDIEEFYKLLEKVENSFSDPFQVTYKKILDQADPAEQAEEKDKEDEEMEGED